ncbi:MAG: tetratricopeptide repeat protein, partial [Phycisphaeraceae bacterium]|nr:tetratricopeptide repeat protein [Phycisphaeraceae bacterium]
EMATCGESVLELPVAEAVGHVLAEDIVSTITMPRFNKSAMDGFAFRHADTQESDTFTVVARIAAGEHLEPDLKPRECVQIMTGAPVPDQCDTVIPIEDTSAYHHYLLGIAQPMAKTEAARACFERAIELDPAFVLPYIGLSNVLLETNEVERAVELLKQARELAEDDPAVAHAEARVHAQ